MKKITCESVFRGHPDKVCDQISDAILDACLKQDKEARVAVECAIKDKEVWLFGEISSKADIDYSVIVKRVLKDVGYEGEYRIHQKISGQSEDIALGVNKNGAGDQGMMFGYAEKNAYNYMPIPLMLTHQIGKKMDELRKEKYNGLFGSDGKCQVTVNADQNGKTDIDTVIVSVQTKSGVALTDIQTMIYEEVLKPILKQELSNVRILINPTGSFVKGGAEADAGLTGRKIIVDTYGGVAHHGGGAFSGKDPSKVDRSAAYYCRYVAKSLVRAGLVERCEVGVAYSIGIAEPVSIQIDTFGTGDEEALLEFIKTHFDFTPANIKKELRLLDVEYEPLSCYGHFGRDDLNVPWEDVDEKAKELSKTWKKTD